MPEYIRQRKVGRAMPYVPGCETDVFLSYAHIDNDVPPDSNKPGWVTQFRDRLQIALNMQLGQRADIWFDAGLAAGEVLDRSLDQKIRGTAVIVAVLTPSYVQSKWCTQELFGFVNTRRAAGDLSIGTKSRIFKVVKTPLPGSSNASRLLPDIIESSFFETEEASGKHSELPLDSDVQRDRIGRLAQDIRDVLMLLRRQRTVYVGEAPQNLAEQQTKIKTELEKKHFRVLSVEQTAPDAHQAVRAALLESSLSIHFVDQLDKSPVNQRAIDASAGASFPAATSSRQILVVRDAEQNARESWRGLKSADDGRVEVLVNPLTADLRRTVLQTANRPLAPVEPEAIISVYLVCDRPDNPLLDGADTRSLRQWLEDRGFEVNVPLADEHGAEFSRDNREKLKRCDGVLVYWGSSRQRWFEQRIHELRAARGWRHGRPFTANGAYIALPESQIKKNFTTPHVKQLIRAFEPDVEEQLQVFVQQLSSADPSHSKP